MQRLAIEGKTHTNSLDMQFVRIEPGTFMMGSENASLSDELTAGKAYLRRWRLGRKTRASGDTHHAILHRYFSGYQCAI